MDSLYRPRRWPSSRAVVMLGLEVIVLVLAVWRLSDAFVSLNPNLPNFRATG